MRVSGICLMEALGKNLANDMGRSIPQTGPPLDKESVWPLRQSPDLRKQVRRRGHDPAQGRIFRISERGSSRRIGEIGQDIGRCLTVIVTGKPWTERKDAGRAPMKEILMLVQLQRQGEVHIASIGGFDLVDEGERIRPR